jgi:glutathione peroxidase
MKTSGKTIYDFTVKDSKGKDVSFSNFKGKPILVVNVASKCGLTPQYEGLEILHKKFSKQGLVIVGFPCNQFGAQEPAPDAEIQQFCQVNYGVTFPVMGKIDVNGPSSSPLYEYLKANSPGVGGTDPIKWNFAKFLIGKDGLVSERFAPTVEPIALETAIVQALG